MNTDKSKGCHLELIEGRHKEWNMEKGRREGC